MSPLAGDGTVKRQKFETLREAEENLSARGYWQVSTSTWKKGRRWIAVVYDNGAVEIYDADN